MKKYIAFATVIMLFLGLIGLERNKIGFLIQTYSFLSGNLPILAAEKPSKPKIKSTISQKSKVDNSSKSSSHQSFNILILGIDARDNNASRADMIMVANINSYRKSIHVVSVPRDTRIAVKGIGYTKITHTHLIGEKAGGNRKGTQATLTTVANLLHCRLDYYIKVNFKGYVSFIDTLGGLDIELPQSIRLTEKSVTLPAGHNHLNGEMTLELTRERFSLKKGDFGRQRNQLMILEAIAKQTFQLTNISKLPDLIARVHNDVVDTNLTDFDLLCLAWTIKQVPEGNLKYYQIGGKAESGLDPLIKTVVYYWRPDMEDVQNIRRYFQ